MVEFDSRSGGMGSWCPRRPFTTVDGFLAVHVDDPEHSHDDAFSFFQEAKQNQVGVVFLRIGSGDKLL